MSVIKMVEVVNKDGYVSAVLRDRVTHVTKAPTNAYEDGYLISTCVVQHMDYGYAKLFSQTHLSPVGTLTLAAALNELVSSDEFKNEVAKQIEKENKEMAEADAEAIVKKHEEKE